MAMHFCLVDKSLATLPLYEYMACLGLFVYGAVFLTCV